MEDLINVYKYLTGE